ncbi:MAG: type II/IV secretion system protein [Lentisphaeria bacterium]|nr:type II/IV secretion system protein [Lentisphaeria bacterium]
MDQVLQRYVDARQVSEPDARLLSEQIASGAVSAAPDEGEVLRWLAQEYGLPYTSLDDTPVDPQLVSLFSVRVLLAHELLPLYRRDDTVGMGTWRLFDTRGIDLLRTQTGLRLSPVLVPRDALQKAIKEHLGVGADTLDSIERESGLRVVDDDTQEDVDLDNIAQDASIIRFVNQILADAIGQRATDVHLEPFEDELRVRYRVDGVLQEVSVPAQLKRYQPAIVSRVKILSNLDIAEKRVPQDGRIKLRLQREEVDVRVSVIPMVHGEAVVMRLLHQASALRGLVSLGMDAREERLIRRVLRLPHGIVLVTGPTGSGKTTTLYAALQEINSAERKIITIEDPVEYRLKGINQIQIHEKAGLTFARGLRSILRHDPDVVLVGEIRDTETAKIAVQASLTGHLVFSTLHTNDAPGALTRLVDMGVEPYLVASSVDTVLAQRLVRVLCPQCKAPDTSTEAARWAREWGLNGSAVIYHAVGCEACRGTGHIGRRAIFEMMTITDEVRRLLQAQRSSGEIRQAAVAHGMRSLHEDGLRLVRAGVTSLEEVVRVTAEADAPEAT